MFKKKEKEEQHVTPIVVEYVVPFDIMKSKPMDRQNKFFNCVFRVSSEDPKNIQFVFHHYDRNGEDDGGKYVFTMSNEDLLPIFSDLLLYFNGIHTFLGGNL